MRTLCLLMALVFLCIEAKAEPKNCRWISHTDATNYNLGRCATNPELTKSVRHQALWYTYFPNGGLISEEKTTMSLEPTVVVLTWMILLPRNAGPNSFSGLLTTTRRIAVSFFRKLPGTSTPVSTTLQIEFVLRRGFGHMAV